MNWTPSASQDAANILDAVPEAYVRLDSEFRYTLVNRAAEKLLGQDRAELLGKVLWEVYPALVGTPFEEHYRRAMAERVTVTFEDYYQPWQRWYAITATPDPDGGIVVRTVDITERKRVEEAADRQVRLNRLLLDSMPCVALLLEPRTRLIVASNQAGVEVGAVPGTTCFETWGKRQTPCPWCLAPTVWATGAPQRCEPEYQGISYEAHWAPVSDDLYLHYAFDVTERKRAEEALRESETQYSSLASASPVGIFRTDREGNCQYANERWCMIAGMSPEQAAGIGWANGLHPEDRERVSLAWYQSVQGSTPFQLEYRFQRSDGCVTWVYGQAKAVQDDSGQTVGYVGTITDITERKLAEQALRESEELHRTILQTAMDGLWLVDTEGRLLEVNEAYCRMSGYSAAELLAMRIPDLEVNETAGDTAAHIQRVLTQGEDRFESRHRRKDGSVFDVEISVQYRPTDGGRLVAFLRDITGRKRVETELRASRQRLALHVQQTPLAVIEFGVDRRVTEWNPGAVAVFGFSREEAVGQHWTFVVPQSVRASLDGVWEELLSQRGGRRSTNENVTRDGRTLSCEWFNTPLTDRHGNTLGVASLVIDITERKRAEEALRESEARYRLLFETSGEAIFLTAEDGVVLSANPEACRIFGRSEAEICQVGRNALVDPNDPRLAPALAERRRTGRFAGELNFIGKDGTVFPAEISVVAFKDSAGRSRASTFLRDISARKRAEAALRESEDRYRNLFDQSGDPILLLELGDGPPLILDANQAALRVHGYSRQEMVGQPISLLEPGITPEAVQERTRLTAEGKPMYMRHRRKDGSVFDVESVARLVQVGGRKVALAVERDITERKRVEAALSESEEKHRRMFETMAQGVVYQAADGRIISANPAAERILGLSLDQMLGKTSHDPGWKSIREDGSELPGREHPAMVTLRTGEPVERFIMGIVDPRENAHTWISVTATPLFQPGATTPFQVYTTFDDITAQRLAEEEKEKLTAQLAQAQKMETIGRLAGGVAHDFNNLLTIINGYSALALHQTKPADPQFQRLTEILRAGERAAGLVSQLLAFSRRQALDPEVLDLNATVGGMEKMLRRLMGEDIEIVVKLDPAIAPILADRHQLDRVIMNLAVNARDAMPGGGTLTLETGERRLEGVCRSCHEQIRPGTYVELTVRDTGMGMDEHTLEHLFEPFFTTKEVGKGTGLGLSMVQGIVIQSGGHVGVESEVGKGSAFHVYLPVAERPAAEPGALPATDAVGGSETILLVEDHHEVRRFIATILEEYGYRVVQAQDAAEALRVCAAQPVDLLVTDVVMPKMSGVELARHARRTLPGLRTLFISGYSEETHEREWESLGGESFLQKPFAPKALAAKVREVLEGR